MTDNQLEIMKGNEFTMIDDNTLYTIDNADQVWLNESDALDYLNDLLDNEPMEHKEWYRTEYEEHLDNHKHSWIWGHELRKLMMTTKNVEVKTNV